MQHYFDLVRLHVYCSRVAGEKLFLCKRRDTRPDIHIIIDDSFRAPVLSRTPTCLWQTWDGLLACHSSFDSLTAATLLQQPPVNNPQCCILHLVLLYFVIMPHLDFYAGASSCCSVISHRLTHVAFFHVHLCRAT